MDMTSLITTLLSSDSVSGVGKAANADKSNVQSVLNAALPLLLNGAKAQSEDNRELCKRSAFSRPEGYL